MDRDQVLFRLFGKYCPEGTILYTEGAPGEELYVIQSGEVRVGTARADTTKLLGAGELLGEEAFFGRAPRTVRAEVVRDTRLIQVSDRTLNAVVRHGPETARQMLDRLLALVGEARGELGEWIVGRILQRVAPHLGGAGTGAISAVELGERSGTAEVDVRLVLEELERRGCLTRDGAGYRAADAVRLREVVERLLAGGER